MGKRRFAQVATSDDEEETNITTKTKQSQRQDDADEKRKGKKKLRLDDEDEGREIDRSKRRKGGGRGRDWEDDDGDEEEEQEPPQEDAKPIGDVIRVSGKGRKKKKHFASFEYDGNVFELEDPVLLTPEDKRQKPYVAIIKDITQDIDGNLMVNGQWFYRPEEAEKRGGGSWEARDTRELFYSFHLDEVPAESVMHKCVVHFVPLNKKLPLRAEHPGFIVQKVYDTVERKLWKLTDKDYEDNKQHEIDLLVQKTRERLGELADVEIEDPHAENVDQLSSKRSIRKKTMNPIDVSRADDSTVRSDHLMKAETPGSCTSDALKYHSILTKFKVLTGDSYRDRWLDKLLQGIRVACNPKEDASADDKLSGSASLLDGNPTGDTFMASVTTSKDNGSDDGDENYWPDVAVTAITALERATHEALGSDFQKYNQKMRQLDFNLKNNAILSRRLLKKELDPVVILTMSPNELKAGLTAEEKTSKEPEESKQLQMTDARCSRCMEKKVGISEIIHAGHGDRYQLECIACGHTWYASRDSISSLTIDAPNDVGNVGTAPWATSKFEDVEKKLVSPREPEKPAVDVFQKTTAAYMPVLETQKSFNRSKSDDPSVPAVNRE
ncbi:protein REPRESSOR OF VERNALIZATION 1 [Typha latifolia]|uniref:protein REPRESSOR OF VERNALIZATION 1 n=1 Tax=Typha latifolia TaxID=4733 RepID=UPI003C2F2066